MGEEIEKEPKANILLVDDDEESLLALESILASLNQNLIKAHSGEEALKYLLNQDVAVILLDVKLPGMDGFEVAALIREREQTQTIPIIFLTGVHIQDQQVFKGYAIGAVDYILKPFIPEILKSKVSVFVELFRKSEKIKRQSALLQKSNQELQGEIEERMQLEEKQKQLSAIVDSSEDAIVSNTLEGTILSWNKGAERIYGYFADEVIGRPLAMLMHPDSPQEMEPILKQIREGERVEHYETTCKRKDGLSIDVSLTISPIRDFSGNMIGVSAIARDITERRNLLRKLLETSEQEQQRIGQDLHDDLCQQLTGIAYMSKALEKKLSAKSLPETPEAAKISKQLDQTISYTRFLAKGLTPTELESGGLVSALQVLAFNIESMTGIPCSFNSALEFPIQDIAVASQLYRMVQEAANNAIKHGQAKHLGIGLTAKDQTVVITVYDDGVGILQGHFDNTGMGLRSIRYRAELIGASVDIQQNVNGGTTVTCSLKQKSFPRAKS